MSIRSITPSGSYLVLGLVVFARQVCLPVPAVLFLLAAGALARNGELNVTLVLGVGILGCLAGDLVWFEAGRRWGSQIMRILYVFGSDPHYCAQRARRAFTRWGCAL
jgi:membrane protein DedA with SNARE-associated domain